VDRRCVEVEASVDTEFTGVRLGIIETSTPAAIMKKKRFFPIRAEPNPVR
jgi:hypothetical protein